MTRQTARGVDAALSVTDASANGHRPSRCVATQPAANLARSTPSQKKPRFHTTPWGLLRARSGWSLRELSGRAEINISDLSRIERGSQSPSPDQALRILVAFGLATAAGPAPESATHPGPALTAYAEDYRQLMGDEP